LVHSKKEKGLQIREDAPVEKKRLEMGNKGGGRPRESTGRQHVVKTFSAKRANPAGRGGGPPAVQRGKRLEKGRGGGGREKSISTEEEKRECTPPN